MGPAPQVSEWMLDNPAMTTAILSALQEEQSSLLQHLQRPRRTMHAGRAFWHGDWHGRPVVLACRALARWPPPPATALVERFGVARIVFTGVAGGVGDGVQVGDVVVAHDYVQHDMDASPCSRAGSCPVTHAPASVAIPR